MCTEGVPDFFFLRMLRSNATAGYAEVVTVKCYVVKCPRGEREGGRNIAKAYEQSSRQRDPKEHQYKSKIASHIAL